ncbi:MAG: sensor domain-containing diguanylate cyclase [Pseudomonadota bacterium]|nr:sensor domain-containing diguanylate cyclase [Pseudomonadota bacterium]
MGSIEIFANMTNLSVTLISILILGIAIYMITRNKIVIKKGLWLLYSGLLLELLTTGLIYKINEFYNQGMGESINTLIFLELFLLLIAMLLMAIAASRILVNNVPESPIITSLGGIGLISIVYFVFISPDNDMVANMQQIFIIAGFICMAVSFWSQSHRRHKSGYTMASIVTSLVTVVLLVRLTGHNISLLNSWYLSPLYYNALAVALVMVYADYVSRKLDTTNTELDKYNKRIEEIIKSSPFPIIISRLSDDKIILANNNAIKLFDIEPTELERYRLKDFFVDAENRILLNERLEQEKEVQDFEILVKSYSGDTPFWLLTSATTIDYNYDVVLYAAFQDITSRKNREVLLKNQATRDPLTSLYNRRYFEDEVNKRIANARLNNGTYCVLMTDVDLFKRVNDTYGHKTGDKVLIELAGACERALRDNDIVARYGGEEFVIYLDDVTIEKAQTVAERLRETIAGLQVPSDDGRTVTFTISIGISSSKVSDNIDTLIKTADEALYKAKQNGRNRVEVFHPSDLKNFNPENNAMHKDETANRHPIFDKEPAAEISLLDGIESNHIVDDKNKIEPNKAPGFSVPGVDIEDL